MIVKRLVEGRVGVLFAVVTVASLGACVNALKEPAVMVDGERIPQGLEGKVQSVSLVLTDPSPMDRLVAAMPVVLVALSVAFAFGYHLVTERRDRKGIPPRADGRIGAGVGMAGLLMCALPLIAQKAVGWHFGAGFHAGWGKVDPVFVVMALSVLLLSAAGSRRCWGHERERAEKLDEQMKEVV
jgi:hypothetical protein